MSSTAKARAAAALLLVLAAWPPLHYVLVSRNLLNPWRFYGFAMYCYPETDILVSFFEVRDGVRTVIPIDSLQPEVESQLVLYRRRHRTYGRLAPDHVERACGLGLPASPA